MTGNCRNIVIYQYLSFPIRLYYIQTPRLYHLALALDHCCNIIEIFCPCSSKELAHLVQFLFRGEMDCENEAEALLVLENLEKIFGYPEKLNMDHPNTVFEVKLIETISLFVASNHQTTNFVFHILFSV